MSNLPYVLDGRYTQGHPLDMEDARKASRAFAEMRRSARRDLENALAEQDKLDEDAAEKKKAHRKARARAYLTVEGRNAGERDAKVDNEVAEYEYDREVAERLAKAQRERIALAKEKLEEIDGERASFHRLVEWSMRVDAFAQEQRG